MELLLIKLFITAHLRIIEGANDFYLAEKIVKYVILLSDLVWHSSCMAVVT